MSSPSIAEHMYSHRASVASLMKKPVMTSLSVVNRLF